MFYGHFSLWCLFNLILTVLFTLGFSLPITTALLLFLVKFSDAAASTGTLGTTILMQTLFVFLLMNSGEYYSIDSILLKKKSVLSKFIRWQYNFIGRHTKTSLTKVYFFAFFIYALISLGAMLMHIQDYYWSNGLTLKSLMSNSYLSLYFEEFRWLENNFPNFTNAFSTLGGVLQSIFQFGMIFLVFSKFGSFFVKWWAIQFFIISLFVINLSYLPHVELVLWSLLFFPTMRFFKKRTNENDVLHEEKVQNNAFVQKTLNVKLLKLFYKSYGILVLVFVLIRFPYVSNYTTEVLGYSKKVIGFVVSRSGLEVPSVFNLVDLSMGDKWMVIYRKKQNSNTWELLPITAENGERLTYSGNNVLLFSNHNSDFLYFGTSLLYRRNIIRVKDYESFHENGVGYESIVKRITYDYKKKNLVGKYNYKITVYKNNSSKVTRNKEDINRHKKEVLYYKKLVFDGIEFEK
jgi:hypothetical protein